MQTGQRTRLEGEFRLGARGGQQRLEIGLDIEEIHRLAHVARHAPLLRQAVTTGNAGQRVDFARRAEALRPGRHEARAMLEQPNAILLPPLILQRRPQQARPQRHPHDRQIAGDRIGERDPAATRGKAAPAAAGSTNA